jgi:hypothetical protein
MEIKLRSWTFVVLVMAGNVALAQSVQKLKTGLFLRIRPYQLLPANRPVLSAIALPTVCILITLLLRGIHLTRRSRFTCQAKSHIRYYLILARKMILCRVLVQMLFIGTKNKHDIIKDFLTGNMSGRINKKQSEFKLRRAPADAMMVTFHPENLKYCTNEY